MWTLAVLFCLFTTLATSDVDFDSVVSTVAVLKNQKPKCLGVILDEKYIATSAHCVFGSTASSLSITTFGQGTQTVSAIRVLVHPYYLPPSLDYDIALLKITPLRGATSVEIGKTEPLPMDEVETIYWDPQNIQTTPKSGLVGIEDRKSCKNKVGKFVSDRMICAYDKQPSVKSDGPLFFDGNLTGIPSKRFESNQGALPAIYTNIANSEIYSFIESFV